MRRYSLMLAALLVSATVSAQKADPEFDRLQAQLSELDADGSLSGLAGLERLKARQALDALRVAKSKTRSHALYIAERRVEAAALMAQVELLRAQSQQLDREHDQLLIESSRREAEHARRDAERLRLQSLAREEEAQRLLDSERLAREASAAEAAAASAEAAQARKLAAARAREAELARQEAELAAAVMLEADSPASLPPQRIVDGRTVYTVAGNAFASGRASLTASAQASLRALAGELASTGSRITINGYTDSQGAAATNLALSQQRADAVRQALADAGVVTSRMKATGHGAAQPIADNATPAGRAQNRRVEIVVQ